MVVRLSPVAAELDSLLLLLELLGLILVVIIVSYWVMSFQEVGDSLSIGVDWCGEMWMWRWRWRQHNDVVFVHYRPSVVKRTK